MKLIDNKRVLHKRVDNTISYNDADIIININSNVTLNETSNVTYNFNHVFSSVKIRFNIGGNKDYINIYNNTRVVYKNMTPGEDLNPSSIPTGTFFQKNFIYLPKDEINSFKKFSITTSAAYLSAVHSINFPKELPSLIELDLLGNGNNIYTNGSDLSFISKLPNLKILRYRVVSGNVWVNYDFLKNSPIELIESTQEVLPVNYLPVNLRYYISKSGVANTHHKLEELFTGSLMGFQFEPIGGPNTSTYRVSYNGGAIFPSVISDQELYDIPYIIYISSNVGNKLTGNELSRFLVDFANQVTSVTTAQKRIRVVGGVPNTSYEDLSQPLFTTYASALAHITTILGITVTFT